ncbi:Hypothetical predicted protein [Cloeon dipterum]|uniref:Uncharacterized protein n=1 Tax=Cloeon dipterum TaxID=197152 RepID=A0A8S1DW52_9INSE|nr:Hypothetical predicted protein [Cloeon dipterum]
MQQNEEIEDDPPPPSPPNSEPIDIHIEDEEEEREEPESNVTEEAEAGAQSHGIPWVNKVCSAENFVSFNSCFFFVEFQKQLFFEAFCYWFSQIS